jgi:hypothetical protein
MWRGGKGGSQKVHKIIPGDLIMTAPLIYTVKKRFVIFPSPARMSLTTLSLAGNILSIPAQGEFGK